jgi:NADPH2:quinone reductase
VAEKARPAQAELFRLYEAGKLKPHVMAVYPFEAYREALAAVRDRHARGKVVIALKQ